MIRHRYCAIARAIRKPGPSPMPPLRLSDSELDAVFAAARPLDFPICVIRSCARWRASCKAAR